MIITFHLAVYFAYHIWEKYISVLFRDDDNPNENDNTDNIDSIPVISTTLVENNTSIEIIDDQPNLTESTINQFATISKPGGSHQVTEGEGDIFINEDIDCRSFIYDVEPKFESFLTDKGLRFVPPVYTQRYMQIERILKQPCWAQTVKKVVDLGCAELVFEQRYLKKLIGVQEIVAVDIDSQMLSHYVCQTTPMPNDFLCPRSTPLKIQVYCGSVANTHQALDHADAVIAIELIEHLYPGDLEHLPFTVFGYIKPKIAMLTTPNADFNVLFTDFSGFRHIDHKFEWSRQQFEDWCNNLVQRYPDYTVTFQGIGPGPAGTEHLGCCSQMAIFVRMYESPTLSEEELHIQDGPYTLLQESDFPYHVDTRSQDEKIRDAAVCFIDQCVSLSRFYDDEQRKELPLSAVMQRIKCHNREKLKNILIENDWKITTNADGYEVILLPDSDSDSDSESVVNDPYRDIDEFAQKEVIDCDNTLVCDEMWDSEGSETKDNKSNTFINDSLVDCLRVPSSDVAIPNSFWKSVEEKEIEKTESNKFLGDSLDPQCCIVETDVPDVNFVASRTNSSDKKVYLLEDKRDVALESDVSHNDSNLDFSLYETPYNNGCLVNSNCELPNPSAQSLCNTETKTSDNCHRVLSFDTPDVRDKGENVLTISGPITEHNNTESFCCVSSVSSPFDTSIYATPCCSQIYKNPISKCLSLEQISPHSSTELECSSNKHVLISDQKDKFSKSMEGFKSQDNCDIHETCSNGGRVVDGGYPDSYSEHNMDMDLTPEQFDDIETESEGNDISCRSLSPPLPLVPPLPRMVHNVENGDVANNNRDGEGNNVVADMEEEPIEFEAQIEEVDREIPNLAVVGDQSEEKLQQICYMPETLEINEDSHVPPSFNRAEKHSPQKFQNLEPSVNEPFYKAIATTDKETTKLTQSDTGIVASNSWSHLELSGSQTYFDVKDRLDKFDNKQDVSKLKTHNSLTTVLDGCSTFSNCSLVCPVNRLETSVDPEEAEPNNFPNWMLHLANTGIENRENTDKTIATKEKNILHLFPSSSQQDHLSLESEYQSAGSLNSLMSDHNDSSFPEWLLAILLPDTDEIERVSVNSVASVWGPDSFGDLIGNYNVQVDARGGGDPQTETWN